MRMEKFVEAYRFLFGGTIAHARQIYASASKEYIEAVITVYKTQNSAAFYED